MSRFQLSRSKPEAVRRLAKFLGLNTVGVPDKKLVTAVWWEITPPKSDGWYN